MFQNYSLLELQLCSGRVSRHTLTSPENCTVPLSNSIVGISGLTGRGVMTSVSSTPFGTVSSMRANKVAHVDAYSSGDFANLYCSQPADSPKTMQRTRPWLRYRRFQRSAYPNWLCHSFPRPVDPWLSLKCIPWRCMTVSIIRTKCQLLTHMLLSKCTKVESKCATDRVSVGS